MSLNPRGPLKSIEPPVNARRFKAESNTFTGSKYSPARDSIGPKQRVVVNGRNHLAGRASFDVIPSSGYEESPKIPPKQSFTYFLVINFQATCDANFKSQPDPREVIECSVTKVDGQTFAVEAIFHQYVSPKFNRKLTKFCTQLTGISQCMIDGQPQLDSSLKKLNIWIDEQGLFKPGVTFATVTHRDWFLLQLLPKNLGSAAKVLPEHFRRWIDIGKIFEVRTGIDTTDYLDPLLGMLKYFDLELEGPRHSGIYVCHNILRIMKALATNKQCVLYINSPAEVRRGDNAVEPRTGIAKLKT